MTIHEYTIAQDMALGCRLLEMRRRVAAKTRSDREKKIAVVNQKLSLLRQESYSIYMLRRRCDAQEKKKRKFRKRNTQDEMLSLLEQKRRKPRLEIEGEGQLMIAVPFAS